MAYLTAGASWSVLRWKVIRHRRHRAKRAQVAAVATIFGLLLVVTFISAFVLQPLPNQMASLEYQHMLQVENQLARLQAVVLAQAHSSDRALGISSPVTLGSQSIPPWSQPSQGVIQPEPGTIRTEENYQVAQIFAHEPHWNFGSNCLFNGSGHCSSNGNIDTWNVTNANNSVFTITVNGNRNSMQYNISGNNDTVTISWTGGDTGFINVVVNGSDDHIIYNKGGSDVTNPTVNYYFYGQRDVFDFNPTGSHSSGGGMAMNVYFIGTLSQICPYGNLSSTDKLGVLSTGGSNLNMTVTWWNALGYVSPPHTVTYPGGILKNESLTFVNRSGVVACAFTQSYSSAYTAQYGAGVLVQLQNHYSAPVRVAYDQGAVVQSAQGGTSSMVSPPSLTYQKLPFGYSVSLTLVNMVTNFTTSAGVATAAVSTHVIGIESFTVVNGQSAFSVASPLFLNITTTFPQAWYSYFASLPQLVPGGAGCRATVSLSPPYSCLAPPVGIPSVISAALVVQSLTVTTVTVEVSVQ